VPSPDRAQQGPDLQPVQYRISNFEQVEIKRQPALRGRPVGVRQKNLLVTTNYEARALGVGKMAKIADVQKNFPEVVIVDGECLDPYREV
jgi:DNA polymerase iota